MQHRFTITTGIHQLLALSFLLKSQVKTLAACVCGLIAGGELSIGGIGTYIPGKIDAKHKIKRVDRWCGNSLVEIDPITTTMLLALGKRGGALLVSVDWTKINNFQVLVFAVTTGHGRAVPVYWEVVDGDEDRTKVVEVAAIDRFDALVPANLKITILADRGFDEVKFIAAVAKRFEYVIRLSRSNTISSSDSDKVFTTLEARLEVKNEAVDFGEVLFTKTHRFKTRIVGIHDWKQKEPWFLATNGTGKARQLVMFYSRRFDIEHAFKDWKDSHHGWKLGKVFTKSCHRLSRLLIIPAIAYLMLVLVGLVGESRKLHYGLQCNTTRNRRVNSVWRVGLKLLTIGKPLYLTVGLLLSFVDSIAFSV